jgi:lipoprotein-releasing system permease protein
MRKSLALLLALRYVRGKRSANAVPILSRISMAAIAVGSAAMIILFSVFNGFEVLVKDLYKAFYPDIRISPVTGKFFRLPPATLDKIAHWPGVEQLAPVIEDNILINTDDDVVVATLKGIDNRYFQVNNVQPYISKGRDSLTGGPMATAIMGTHIAARIGLDVNNDFSKLQVHYFNTKTKNPGTDLAAAYQSLVLKPDGIFRVQDEFDDKYILGPIEQTQQLFNAPGKVSSIELKTVPGESTTAIKKSLQQLLGSKYRIETRFEQNRTLYQVLKTEKWATYAILLFVLLIASVNMIGALSLLVLEKRKDMAILSAMGATKGTIRSVFLFEGMLWSCIGGLAGLLLGGSICLAQQRFGLLSLGDSFVIKAYPVAMLLQDFILVFVTVIFVGLVAAWYPAMKAVPGAAERETIYNKLR